MSEQAQDELGGTIIKQMEQFKDRWSSFGGNSGILSISEKLSAKELGQYEIFKDFDEKFLEKISPDISVAIWKKDAILFEEGSYIDLAFFIVHGKVHVHLQPPDRKNDDAAPIFDELRTMVVTKDTIKNALMASGEKSPPETILNLPQSDHEIRFLSSLDKSPSGGSVTRFGPGEMFGEIGGMTGWPHPVTAQTVSDCSLIQIRVAALRAMKRKSSQLRAKVDQLYREQSLITHLKATPLLQSCQLSDLNALKEVVELVSCDPDETIVREGSAADAFYLLRSGFVKLLQKSNNGDIVVSYLSKGMSFGEIELLLDHLNGWEMTAVSVENAELIKIPKDAFRRLLIQHPEIEALLWKTAVARIKEAGHNKRNIASSEFTQVAINKGLVQANSLLVIDLDTCVRCDDCVRACAATHNGRPRFIREGDKYDNLLIPKSCYHCRDPVCLVGCPTGAIHRAGVDSVIKIEENICIGCGTCASNCPYNAIVMHETGKAWPVNMVPAGLRGKPQKVASKCDLCVDMGTGPACVSNCPQESTIRIGSIDLFQGLLTRQGAPSDERTASSQAKKKPIPWRSAFLFAVMASVGVFAYNVMTSELRPDNIWGLSYGVGAAFTLVIVGMFGSRRRMMKFATRFRLGRSYSWLRLHLYGGGLFLLLMLMHTGFHFPLGFLERWIWVLSLWTVFSGLFGLTLQRWLPKVLSSGLSTEIHYDRIQELVDQIRERAEALLKDCGEQTSHFYRKKIMPSLRVPERRWVYFTDITGGLQSGLREFDHLKSISNEAEKARLNDLLVLYKSKLKIDVHYTLQRPLRVWLYTHLPLSMLLVAFVMLHIFMVTYY